MSHVQTGTARKPHRCAICVRRSSSRSGLGTAYSAGVEHYPPDLDFTLVRARRTPWRALPDCWMPPLRWPRCTGWKGCRSGGSPSIWERANPGCSLIGRTRSSCSWTPSAGHAASGPTASWPALRTPPGWRRVLALHEARLAFYAEGVLPWGLFLPGRADRVRRSSWCGSRQDGRIAPRLAGVHPVTDRRGERSRRASRPPRHGAARLPPCFLRSDVVLRTSWTPGPAEPTGKVLVSVTDFTANQLSDMPRIYRAGTRLARLWPTLEGAVGHWLWMDPVRRRSARSPCGTAIRPCGTSSGCPCTCRSCARTGTGDRSGRPPGRWRTRNCPRYGVRRRSSSGRERLPTTRAARH
jgi:hypothetical protein